MLVYGATEPEPPFFAWSRPNLVGAVRLPEPGSSATLMKNKDKKQQRKNKTCTLSNEIPYRPPTLAKLYRNKLESGKTRNKI